MGNISGSQRKLSSGPWQWCTVNVEILIAPLGGHTHLVTGEVWRRHSNITKLPFSEPLSMGFEKQDSAHFWLRALEETCAPPEDTPLYNRHYKMAGYHITTHFFVPFFHNIIFPRTAPLLLSVRGWIQVTQELTSVSFWLVELCTFINIVLTYDTACEYRLVNTEWPQHNP